MTTDQIDNFLRPEILSKAAVKISFKSRNMVVGVFVQTPEFNDLKAKNFWRIVPVSSLEQWNKTKDMSLVKIFNGAEFTKLSAA